MWEQELDDIACFRVSGWRLQVHCQPDGVRLISTEDSSEQSVGLISLVGGHLPPITESYVRGDELHLLMPQNDGTNAGLELVLLVVFADRDCLVVESTLAVQTLLLDAHPTIELGIPGDGVISSYSRESATVFAREEVVGSKRFDRPSVRVLVDRRDQLSIDKGCDSAASLRLFGEFMEKGVIRKAQPWWVWSSVGLDDTRLRSLVVELAKRPLPLAG
jgi:hypothetical protein